MPIRMQTDFPPLTSLGATSPMISNLSYDHQAWVHPMQSYIWVHDIYKACRDILGIEMPEVQYNRFSILEFVRIMEDCSGRSTGKTHNYLIALAVMSVCLNLHSTVWLGQAKDIGVEIFDTYLGEWIEYEPNFKRFCTAKGNHKAKVSHNQSGAMVSFFNGSRMLSLSPNPNRDYTKMQSWRFNHGIFNEWTSWPYIQEIPDKVEPIFTKTNLQYRQTKLFREAMEQVLGIELGRLSNDTLNARHMVQDYIPRDYLENINPAAWPRALELFYQNFEMCFGFDYRHGVKDEDLQFIEIKSPDDLVYFFKDYDEGDPAYFNKLIYDGSAKRPSDDCHWMHKMIGKRVEAKDKLYGQYSIGVDDIPVEWDGIIFDSTMIEKARKQLLAEDFNRVYGGKWTEGRAKNPFPWQDVLRASTPGWLGKLARSGQEVFMTGVDSAQGTDKTFSTNEGVKDGRGDDGVIAVYELGDGTSAKPHKLCYVKIAEDVRSEPWAYNVQDVESRFEADYHMIDPGGGGKGLLEKLAKRNLSMTDGMGEVHEKEVIPMLPWDHEDPGDSKINICIFSLSNEMLTAAYVDSKTQKALFQYADQLNNHMVKIMQDALRDKTVAFPQFLDESEIIELYHAGDINDDELMNLMDMRKALRQLVHLRYKTDRSNKRKKTDHGVFTYESSGKKDVAWTILMGYMMCDLITKMIEIQNSDDEESSYLPDVE